MDIKTNVDEKHNAHTNMDSTPSSPSSTNKEHDVRKTEVVDPEVLHIGSGSETDESEDSEMDPFVPFPDMEIEEGNPLTVRAVVIGCLLGGLVNASNTYLGLKTGWGFPVNLFGAILGFSILKSLSATFPHVPILGGKFGPKENAIIQTAATAAGGLSPMFVSAIPALYRLNLLGDSPSVDFPRLLTFTIVAGYYGLFFSTPLRKYFLVDMARELHAIFPTATATALSIRGLHSVGADSKRKASKMARGLLIALFGSIVFKIVAPYAPGILWDWHIFSWFFVWSGYSNYAIVIENWTWVFQWTPAFIGTGMLAGMNTAVSFFSGNIICWAIIGPILIKTGTAVGKPFGYAPDEPGYEKWHRRVNYMSLTGVADPSDPTGMTKLSLKDAPSPRYWLLWPGVAVMVAASFAEIGVQYKYIWAALVSGAKGTLGAVEKSLNKFGKESAFLQRISQQKEKREGALEDPFPESEQVRSSFWSIPLVFTIIFTVVILALQFKLPVGLSLFSIVLGFFFAFLAVQATGTTDITPTTATGKASQFILGGCTSGYVVAGNEASITSAQRLNIMGGAVSIGASQAATDMVMDFRVGYLLRCPPRLQWYAQIIGTIVAIFLAPGMFVLFTKAYPCIIDQSIDQCTFIVPSSASWQAVTMAVTDPTFPVPKSSWVFAIIISLVAIATTIFKYVYLIGERAKYRVYMPNYMAMGLAFVLPTTTYGNAMMFGALIAHFWMKLYPKNHQIYCYAIAAGAIAGEGLGGCIGAVLQIAGVGGQQYGSAVGCPGDEYCG
ncbi:OPT superfamily oligopeptide transporter [Ascobolus immersus RN42]|uniref:OPT superfamily oligopeptide transporter n=1 Tax=Ascobolus immersus RN42 TaxID=1160509 RepID=A0A3N4IGQ5_ASCIM|nr:OPT superfamily oligopeptide transporter [Ascobolus immersus RN42]